MKIAKKLLAVVMAVAIVACLSAMAFAAPAGASFVLTASEPDAKGFVTVTLTAKNAVCFKSGQCAIGFDSTVLDFKAAALTDDAKQAEGADNVFNALAGKAEVAADKSAAASYGFYFLNSLYAQDEFVAAAEDMGNEFTVADVNNYALATFKFKVVDGATAASTVVTFKGEAEFVDDNAKLPVDAKVTVTLKDEPTTKKVEPSSAVVTTVEEDPSKNPNTGDDQKTGDNYALAAAAGVVVLAGAALVITKKRK